MSPELWTMAGGFAVNAMIMIGAFLRFAVANEARLTRIETHLEHMLRVIPKRRDEVPE